jgi:hypothetical protein
LEPAATIGKLGFKRWYERQLVEGHAWLVTCFLCMLTVAACLEDLSFRGPLGEVLAIGATVFAAGLVGIYGWDRYRRIMQVAEYVAGQSTCGACKTYAAFKLIGADSGSMHVRCRKCAHEWRIG